MQSEDPHFKIGGCWFLRESGTLPSSREKNKSFGGRTDEGRRWNQYVAHLFPLSLPFSFYPFCLSPSLPLSFFLTLLNPPTKPLLLVSDFYLVAPGPRFISRSPLSFSLDSFFSFPFLPLIFYIPSLLLSPTNSPQPRTVRNFLFRISDP